MISCELCGGLGNQLFQIFATIAYALENKSDFIFLRRDISPSISHRITYWNNFLQSLQPFLRNSLPSFPHQVSEKRFAYDPLPLAEGDTLLKGYFQTEKYFVQHLDRILELINLEPQREAIRIRWSWNPSKTTVSLHFRLGDYKHLQHCHPLIPLQYYISSLNFLLSRFSELQVIYFYEKEDQEEIDRRINQLRATFPQIEFLPRPDSLADYEELLLMSCCQHHIIANSSFSWWGAYLNRNPEKIVCYPHLWFGPQISADLSDLAPSSWNKIGF